MNLLILSIGSNPLPNYIVAKYLLSDERDKFEINHKLPKPDKIMFAYSSMTEKFQKSIVEELDLSPSDLILVNFGCNNERNFNEIKSMVSRSLDRLTEDLKQDNSTIHLNYTGGTKPMALGLFSAVEHFDGYEVKKIYSDLSPSELKLTLPEEVKYPNTGNMTSYVTIDIEQLYRLHGLSKTKAKREYTGFPKQGKSIEFLFDKTRDYKNGDEYFYSELWEPEYDSKNKETLLKSIEGAFNIDDKISDKQMKKLRKYIRGTWLEEYLYMTIRELQDDKNTHITDVAQDIETRVSGREFQVDVITIQGCKPILFTCTTDDSAPGCKGKAFEGIYRSEQIGGEHSKTVLVCMADNCDKDGNRTDNQDYQTLDLIKKDMSQFDAERNFTILGIDDIQPKDKFKERLLSIFKGGN